MSHNITLKNVTIKDLDMFGQVVTELSNGAASLVMPASNFRTFPGQPNRCDAKIAMPGPHDVGLLKNSDGSYSVTFDPYAMNPVFKHADGTNKIGALLQEYTLREAEYTAAQQGMETSRVHGDKGVVTLEMIPAA